MNKFKPQFESKSKPSLVLKLAFLQFIGTVVFSLILLYCFDTREALSAFFGGLIAAIASIFFASRLFTTKNDAQATEMLVRFYFSVTFKMLFTLVMMAICIIVIKVSMLPFIIAYLLAAVIMNLVFLLVPTNDIVDNSEVSSSDVSNEVVVSSEDRKGDDKEF